MSIADDRSTMLVRLLAVVASCCLAAYVVWRATAAGLTFTPDGVAYLEAARSFAVEGRLWLPTDCGLSHTWLNAYAPLYPVLIGLGIKAGWDPFGWARVLNILCAALATAAAAWATLRLSGSALAALLAGCAIAMLPESLANYRSIQSEPPCIALVMMGLLALEIGLSTRSIRTVWLAALSLGLAAVARYGALPLLAPAALFVWLMARRIRPVIEFLAVGTIPTVIVALVNRYFSGGAPPRPFALHLPHAREFVNAAKTIAEWFSAATASGIWETVLVAVGLAATTAFVFRRGNFRGGAALALALLFTHMLVILAARTFFDITVDLGDQRQLILLFSLWIVALGGALPLWLLIPVLAFFPAIHLRDAVHRPAAVKAEYNSNHPSWRGSETLARAGALDPGVCLYASRPDVIYRRFNRPVEWLPQRVEWFTARPQPWCLTAKESLARHPRSAYLFFDTSSDIGSVVSEPELTDCLRHTVRIRLRDGTILLAESER
jgi:hypothetical protein